MKDRNVIRAALAVPAVAVAVFAIVCGETVPALVVLAAWTVTAARLRPGGRHRRSG